MLSRYICNAYATFLQHSQYCHNIFVPFAILSQYFCNFHNIYMTVTQHLHHSCSTSHNSCMTHNMNTGVHRVFHTCKSGLHVSCCLTHHSQLFIFILISPLFHSLNDTWIVCFYGVNLFTEILIGATSVPSQHISFFHFSALATGKRQFFVLNLWSGPNCIYLNH